MTVAGRFRNFDESTSYLCSSDQEGGTRSFYNSHMGRSDSLWCNLRHVVSLVNLLQLRLLDRRVGTVPRGFGRAGQRSCWDLGLISQTVVARTSLSKDNRRDTFGSIFGNTSSIDASVSPRDTYHQKFLSRSRAASPTGSVGLAGSPSVSSSGAKSRTTRFPVKSV